MEYRRLGGSGLKVSEIGLGCNIFGWRADEQTSAAIINRALDVGINFIDTADGYPPSAPGRSEECVGKAIKNQRSRLSLRDRLALAQNALGRSFIFFYIIISFLPFCYYFI